ncbi:hypothetical protein ACKVWC_008771 [Pyricularia oryzae]|nr:hypothetical protein MCOR01_002114 [Pyricularia oryzae]KAI6288178.1 hypothetical protein MCOR26_000186 [Pyricularia oryzae]KAI6322973.1 hypothetical protein MCOR34_002054 [Pyricularia oryzae]KAI6345572.1 hypothetical protein MCOR28_003492 [Pyricularia oryzae]KAI6379707.1 hypothetical protein MCOR32_004412 [Pyricularia oryzae]
MANERLPKMPFGGATGTDKENLAWWHTAPETFNHPSKLWTDYWMRYNTITTSVQSRESYLMDVMAAARECETRDELEKLLDAKYEQRVAELVDAVHEMRWQSVKNDLYQLSEEARIAATGTSTDPCLENFAKLFYEGILPDALARGPPPANQVEVYEEDDGLPPRAQRPEIWPPIDWENDYMYRRERGHDFTYTRNIHEVEDEQDIQAPGGQPSAGSSFGYSFQSPESVDLREEKKEDGHQNVSICEGDNQSTTKELKSPLRKASKCATPPPLSPKNQFLDIPSVSTTSISDPDPCQGPSTTKNINMKQQTGASSLSSAKGLKDSSDKNTRNATIPMPGDITAYQVSHDRMAAPDPKSQNSPPQGPVHSAVPSKEPNGDASARNVASRTEAMGNDTKDDTENGRRNANYLDPSSGRKRSRSKSRADEEIGEELSADIHVQKRRRRVPRQFCPQVARSTADNRP